MSTPQSGRGARRSRRGVRAALFAVLAVVLTALVPVAAAPVARAADNDSIQVVLKALRRTTPANADLPGGLRVSDTVALDFEWSLRPGAEASLKTGDSFTVSLPEPLRSRVPGHSSELRVLHGGESVAVGVCVAAPDSFTCALSDVLPSKIREGWRGVGGTATFQMSAAAATQDASLAFGVSGYPNGQALGLPGGGGIAVLQRGPYSPEPLAVGMTGMSEYSKNTHYHLGFDTDRISEYYEAAGASMAFDGAAERTITLVDALGPGQRFSDPGEWVLRLKYSKGSYPQVVDTVLAKGDGRTTASAEGGFAVKAVLGEAGADGQEARIELTGPWDPSTKYELEYWGSPVGSDYLEPGLTYSNRVKLVDDANGDGVEEVLVEKQVERSFVPSFSSTVKTAPAYGSFQVQKSVAGPGSALVPKDQEYTIKVDYELPLDASAYHPDEQAYPGGWAAYAPGALNPDGRSGTATMSVTQGAAAVFTGKEPSITFPKGTRVTLSEVGTDSQAPTGYRWSAPRFEVGGAATNTIEIGDGTLPVVQVTNRLEPTWGTFTVSKTLAEGSSAGAERAYTFAYSCDDPAASSGTITGVRPDGAPVASGALVRAGSSCTVREDAAEAAIDGHTLAPPAERTITISGAGQASANASFENAYAPDTGSFRVKRAITGDRPAGAGPSTVAYSCTNGAAGELELAGDGDEARGPALPSGASCTIERAPRTVDGYAVATSYSATRTTITKGSDELLTVTDDYRALKGAFTIAKSVDGDGAALVGDQEFFFEYTCAPTGGDPLTRTVSVKAGQSVQVEDVPAGTCTVKEAAVDVPNASSARSLTVNGSAEAVADGAATVRVADGASALVASTSTYTLDAGSFSVTGRAAGGALESAPGAFAFDYACADASGRSVGAGTLRVGAGETRTAGPFPVGSSCGITQEDARVGGAGLATSWTVDGAAAQGQRVVVGIGAKGSTAAVEAVNTYTRETARFAVVKNVEANGAPVPQSFTFTYVCGAGGESRVLTVPGDGTPVESEELPVGTQCALAEQTDAAWVPGHSLSAQIADGGVVEVGPQGSVARVVATNTYTPIEAEQGDPGPDAGPSGGAGLALTGSSAPVLLGGSLALAVLGGSILVLRRRGAASD